MKGLTLFERIQPDGGSQNTVTQAALDLSQSQQDKNVTLVSEACCYKSQACDLLSITSEGVM